MITMKGAAGRRLAQTIYYLALLIMLGGIVSTGCRDTSEVPVVTTTEPTEEGMEVVVTRVVRRTIEIPRQLVTVDATPVVMEADNPVELDIGFDGDFTVLDPQVTEEDNAITLIQNVLTGLTRYNHQSDTIEPELAKSWQVSDDGRKWTFELRDDIFWVEVTGDSSGLVGNQETAVRALRPVLADDVVFAVQRACDPRVPTPDVFILFVIEGCEMVNRLADVSEQDMNSIGAKALSDHRLEITLNEPASHFLSLTSMWQLRPVPIEYVVEMEEEWDDPEVMITSGPFVFSTETLEGTRTVLLRNPYWPIQFSGNVDKVNIVHGDTREDTYQMWADRDLDLSLVPLDQQTSILTRHAQKADLVSNHDVFYLAYNFDSPAFSVPEVRRAFSWAIDRERLIREVHRERGLPLRHFAPPGTIGAPPVEQVGVGYSPDRARQEMDASIFGDCRLMPTVTYLVSSSDIALQQAELLRTMWVEELGCAEEQIVIEQAQFGTLLANTRPDAGARRPDLWDLGWASYYPDENNWVGDVLHCINSENRQKRPCSEVDSLIQTANETLALEERQELYRQIEGMLFGEGAVEPISPLYVRAEYELRQPWLTFTPAHLGGEQFDTYLIDATVKSLERSR